jgi:hypothetical protein
MSDEKTGRALFLKMIALPLRECAASATNTAEFRYLKHDLD